MPRTLQPYFLPPFFRQKNERGKPHQKKIMNAKLYVPETLASSTNTKRGIPNNNTKNKPNAQLYLKNASINSATNRHPYP